MPIPIYLICSESGAVDETTKLASHFNLVEKLQFARLQIAPGQSVVVNSAPLRLSSYWMREDADPPEMPFEFGFFAIPPNATEETLLATGEVRLGTSRFTRVNVQGVVFNQTLVPGILRLEARIRRVGEQEWLNRAIYAIELEEIQPPAMPILPATAEGQSASAPRQYLGRLIAGVERSEGQPASAPPQHPSAD